MVFTLAKVTHAFSDGLHLGRHPSNKAKVTHVPVSSNTGATTSPSADIGCKKPLFEFTDAIFGDQKLAEIREYALTKLGCDNTSAHFIHRTKNIAFVVISNNNVFSLEQNFFVQHVCRAQTSVSMQHAIV